MWWLNELFLFIFTAVRELEEHENLCDRPRSSHLGLGDNTTLRGRGRERPKNREIGFADAIFFASGGNSEIGALPLTCLASGIEKKGDVCQQFEDNYTTVNYRSSDRSYRTRRHR